MMRHRITFAFLAAAGLATAAGLAHADMGRAPVPQGIILSFEGGYLYQAGPDVTGHGTSPVPIVTLDEPVTDVLVSPENGYFLGGFIGFDAGTPYFLGLHRVELAFLYGETDDSVRSSVPPFGDIVLSTVDGAVVGIGGTTARTTIERRTWEAALRFEGDDRLDSSTTVTYVLSPFIRGFEEDTRTVVTACCEFGRTASVDSTLYGIYFAAEPEAWITSNLAIVGRLGAGVYGYDGDGTFRSFGDALTTNDFVAAVSDGDSGAGFRGLLGIGLKFRVAPNALLEGFAEADYFSHVPTAHLTSNSLDGGYVSHVTDDDLWELRTGLRLTVGIGN